MILVTVDSKGHELDKAAADAYAALLARARLDGIEAPSLEILSAYRSVEKQEVLWKNALAKYGSVAAARKWVAPPGKSDHNRGIAIDFRGPKQGLLSKDDPAWEWMSKQAHGFGFKSYEPEPWHWTYRGSWAAAARSIPSWAKWATGGAIALYALWPAEDMMDLP